MVNVLRISFYQAPSQQFIVLPLAASNDKAKSSSSADVFFSGDA